MKRLYFPIIAVVIVFCAALFFIRAQSNQIVAPEVVIRTDVLDKSLAPSESPEENPLSEVSTSKILLYPNEVLLRIYEDDIDEDQLTEQILVVKRSDDPTEHIWLILAHLDYSKSTYIRLWEGITASTNIQTFSITISDLIGDHSLAIVCNGVDNLKQQTLTVFWRPPNNSNERTSYLLICRIIAEGRILIQESERSEAYLLNQTNGAPYSIISYAHDGSSTNPLDQIETTWEWNTVERAYKALATKRLPGGQVAKQRLDEILNGGEAAFEHFLYGLWYKEEDGLSPHSKTITFDAENKSILFLSNETQEAYTWDSSHPTHLGLYVRMNNNSINTLSRNIDIELAGTDTISISVYEALNIRMDTPNAWNGKYIKITSESQKELFNNKGLKIAYALSLLKGKYLNETGYQFSANYPKYEFTTPTSSESGGYAITLFGNQYVLSLMQIGPTKQENNLEKAFIIEITETRDQNEKRVIRKLSLKPALFTIDGVKALPGQAVILFQEEKLK